ncbi:MAG: TIM barrel protein [Clostridia bacterium]|nr:TIM barrel protein [Clostridia bacterium]
MKHFPIGLCSVSFRKRTPKEILEEMRKASLNLIEWGSDIHAPATDGNALLELARLQEEYGVTCSSYGTYFKIGIHSAKELPCYIQAARILGTSTLRLWAGEKNSEDFSENEKESFFKECRALAKIAEDEGIVLCTDCHNKTYTNHYQSALELLQAVDSPNFRTYWQPNQFRNDDYNLASAKALAPYTENIHTFHWREKEKFPLRSGTEIWKQYLKCFSGEKSLLLEFMPDGKIESLITETNTLRSITEELK